MKILCLESTAKVASAAILEDGEALAEYTVAIGKTHSELLLPMVRSLLSSVAMTENDIDLFACTVGPGSFTGVRIGVSLLKGLAFGRGVPCAPVSSLEALAETLVPLDGLLCPVMDARRGQVYNALFRYTNGALVRLTPDRAISLPALASELLTQHAGEPCRLVGDGMSVAETALAEAGITPLPTPHLLRAQNAVAVGRCALRMAARGETVSDDALRPLYLRLPQAERERLERLRENNQNQGDIPQ